VSRHRLRADGPADNRPDTDRPVIEVLAAERDAGQRLWADMDTVLQRAQDK
jgi:hypothetical protein